MDIAMDIDKTKSVVIEDESDSDVPVRSRSRFMPRGHTSLELENNKPTNLGSTTSAQKPRGMQEDLGNSGADITRKELTNSFGRLFDQVIFSGTSTPSDEGAQKAYEEFANDLRRWETPDAIQQLYPMNLQPKHRPSLPLSDEAAALDRLVEQDHSQKPSPFEKDEYTEYLLNDFEVYNDIRNRYPGQFADLHTVASEESLEFLFDGSIEGQHSKFLVQRAYINTVSIGGLQDRKVHTTSIELYLQSQEGFRRNIWYRLGQPSTQYASTFQNFQWIADLTKHFVDYLEYCNEIGKDVHLKDFKVDFVSKLTEWHEEHQQFKAWQQRAQVTSLHVAKYARFLRDQVYSLEYACATSGDPYDGPMFKHHVWKQICPETFPSGRQTLPCSDFDFDGKTVVTQEVFESFRQKFTHWTDEGLGILKVVQPSPEVMALRLARSKKLAFPDKSTYRKRNSTTSGINLAADILERVGIENRTLRLKAEDLVNRVIIARKQTSRMNENRGRFTKRPDFEIRYALGRGIRIYQKRTCLDIVWLHHPGSMRAFEDAYYPFENELFLSTECCCEPADLSQVIGVCSVSVFATQAPEDPTFFICQTYFEDEERIVTATTSHLMCRCTSKKRLEREAKVQEKILTTTNLSISPGPKLKTMSLFTGSGLFDRGLEESEVIETVSSIDINEFAMQTNIANQRTSANNVTGDVNISLVELASSTKRCPDMIVGGPVCNGWSTANQHKGSKKSHQQRSLITCTVSFISLLLPFFGLIENVPQMDSGNPNACSQVICFLVSLGYQVGKYFMSASELGAPQQRARLYIIAVAPGFPFPADPRWLFKGTNKCTVGDAITDLPPINNDTTINIQLPDHIPLKRIEPLWGQINIRRLIEKIPPSPEKMNLPKLRATGQLANDEERWLSARSAEAQTKRSRAWTRIDVEKPFPAMITAVNPQCARLGRILHPFENRTLSLEEVKIAFGVPPGFVLIGPPSEQLRQSGNMVVFQVGSAFGKVIARSWLSWAAAQNAQAKGIHHSQLPSSANLSRSGLQRSESEAVNIQIQKELIANVPSPARDLKHETSMVAESDSDDIQVVKRRKAERKSTIRQRNVLGRLPRLRAYRT